MLRFRGDLVLGASAVCVLLGLGGVPAASAAETYYIPKESTAWRFFKGLEEPSPADLGAWRGPDFDDAAWETGDAPFGYNPRGNPLGTDLHSLEPPMRDNYTTLYLRKTVDIRRPDLVNALIARVKFDDAFVLWINGTELLRINAPGAEEEHVPFDAVSTRAHTATNYESNQLPDPQAYITEGANIIAIQGLNTAAFNTDFYFDLELVDPDGPDVTPPTTTLIIPPPGITVRNLEEITVTFSEEVMGIEAADLIVDGTRAKRIIGSGAGPYTFIFDVPAPGPVTVTWAPDHGIMDTSQLENPFEGTEWTYTLDPNTPPPDLVISEFMASNGRTLLDEDGESSDWIELRNRGDQPVNLVGWSLTDNALLPNKWMVPAVELGPGEYLVVFASAKDRRPTGGELHTNFVLDQGGEYLGLYSPDAPPVKVMDFGERFTEQRAPYSYGFDEADNLVYFLDPTPGKPNAGDTALGFVADPTFSVEHGVYDEPFSVELSCPTAGATIYYRMDPDGGATMNETGEEYGGEPLLIEGEPGHAVVAVRAVAYKADYLPSNVVASSYIFREAVLNQPRNPAGGWPTSWRNNSGPSIAGDYEMDQDVLGNQEYRDTAWQALMDVPSMLITMDINDLFGTNGIYSNANQDCPVNQGAACRWEKPCSAEMVYPDGRKGFQINCGIRMQGGSSRHSIWKVPKLSFRLVFRSSYGPPVLRFPLFPDSRIQRFDTLVIDAKLNQVWYHPSSDQTNHAGYARELFCDDVQNLMGGTAPHDTVVNLYVNGLHWGWYNVHERADHAFAASYHGGRPEDYNCLKHNPGTIINPDPPNTSRASQGWNAMMSVASGQVDNTRYQELKSYLDIDHFCDYMIMNLYAGNSDWAHQNWYATQHIEDQLWRFHSWDAEHVLKIHEVSRSVLDFRDGGPTTIFTRLRNNPEFRVRFGDHLHRHFFNDGILYVNPENSRWDPDSPENNRAAALYMKWVETMDELIVLESARWGDYRRPTRPYTKQDWLNELNGLLISYFPARSRNVINQFRSLGLYPRIEAPVFSQHGGIVDAGFPLAMTVPGDPTGTIYYTTDGADPREEFTEAVSANATVYENPIVIEKTTLVKARVNDEGSWSALTEAIFRINEPLLKLRVTEIMYHPPPGGQFTADEYEFVELKNAGTEMIDLTNAAFTNGIEIRFSEGTILPPAQFMVLVSNEAAFRERYPQATVHGIYTGRLDNDGDTLTVKSAGGESVLTFRYRDGGWWPREADGQGHSLVLVDQNGTVDLSHPTSWTASTVPLGTPGEGDPTDVPPQITEDPEDVTARQGERVTFTVKAHGVPAPTYQWQKNDTDIPGATDTAYTTEPLTPGDNGATFRCVVSNARGSATSRRATVTVLLGAAFKRGDTNGDGRLTISDAVRLLKMLFLAGVTTTCEDAADTNDDGTVNIADAQALLIYQFLSGAPIAEPYEECGYDDTTDDLGCEAYQACP